MARLLLTMLYLLSGLVAVLGAVDDVVVGAAVDKERFVEVAEEEEEEEEETTLSSGRRRPS
jgi:hypothetical protein